MAGYHNLSAKLLIDHDEKMSELYNPLRVQVCLWFIYFQ